MGAGPAPRCPGALTPPTRPVSARKEGTAGKWLVSAGDRPTVPNRGSDFLSGPCPRDGCLNATCSGQLVFWPCAPCPLTCGEVSGRAVCSADQPCSSPGKGGGHGAALGPGCGWCVCGAERFAGKPHPGPSLGCWCPAGQVLGSEGQCVWPRQCPCLVDGTRYWPGQRIKASCQLCICQDGRPQRCRPDPDCVGEAPPLTLPKGSLSPPRLPSWAPSPPLTPESWFSHSELWLVILVPLG